MVRSLLAASLLAASLCACLCGRAAAHSNGTLFSSPVDGDGAALFWNPAAMAASSTSRFDLVLYFTAPQASFQRRGVDVAQTGRPFPKASLASVVPEPHIGLVLANVYRKRLRLGLDVTLPRLAGAGWPATVKDGDMTVLGPTRYYVTSAMLIYAYLQAGASFALHRTFAIGASANILFSSIDIQQHLDLGNTPPLRDALPCTQSPLGCENPDLSTPVRVTGWGISAGATVGILWQPIPRLRIGLSYMSPVKIEMRARLVTSTGRLEDFVRQFLPGFGALAINANGIAHVMLPQRVHFAIAGDVHPRVELMASFRWINYRSAGDVIAAEVISRESTLVPETQRLPSFKNDEWTVAVRVTGRVRERWKLGFGAEFVNKVVPDAYVTPSSVDFDSLTFTIAAQVRAWRHLYLGLMFAQSIVLPRTITESAYSNDAPAPYGKPDPGGRYAANAERFGLDLSYQF